MRYVLLLSVRAVAVVTESRSTGELWLHSVSMFVGHLCIAVDLLAVGI